MTRRRPLKTADLIARIEVRDGTGRMIGEVRHGPRGVAALGPGGELIGMFLTQFQATAAIRSRLPVGRRNRKEARP